MEEVGDIITSRGSSRVRLASSQSRKEDNIIFQNGIAWLTSAAQIPIKMREFSMLD